VEHETGAPPQGGAPLRRNGLLPKILPFAALACLAEASLALPPGPVSAADAAASIALLAAVAGAIAFLPWDRLPAWSGVLVPLLYTASVLLLIQAAGGSNSGVTIVVLSPLIWTVLQHRPWESACVAVAVLGVVLAISLMPDEAPTDVLIRRMLFWAALVAMIAFAGHGLRARVHRSQQETARVQDRLRELSILADRDRIAASLHDTVVQRLFAAGLSLQGVAVLSGHPGVKSRIDEAVHDLDESITLLRESIFSLERGLPGQDVPEQDQLDRGSPDRGSPDRGWLDHGLRRSILDASSQLTPGLGVVPEVTLEGPIDTDVPAQAATQLLEALRTALACSGASADAARVAVAVTVDSDAVTLTIADDGTQWTARSADADLSRLRERATLVGGTMAIESAPGGMTRLTWRAPLAEPGGRGDDPPAPAPPSPDLPEGVTVIPRGAPSR